MEQLNDIKGAIALLEHVLQVPTALYGPLAVDAQANLARLSRGGVEPWHGSQSVPSPSQVGLELRYLLRFPWKTFGDVRKFVKAANTAQLTPGLESAQFKVYPEVLSH